MGFYRMEPAPTSPEDGQALSFLWLMNYGRCAFQYLLLSIEVCKAVIQNYIAVSWQYPYDAWKN